MKILNFWRRLGPSPAKVYEYSMLELSWAWKKDFDLWVVSSSLNHIDTVICGGTEKAWRFTGFYGAPETHHRSVSWNLLRNLHNQFSLPWLFGADFNELVKSHEKKGRCPRPYGQM